MSEIVRNTKLHMFRLEPRIEDSAGFSHLLIDVYEGEDKPAKTHNTMITWPSDDASCGPIELTKNLAEAMCRACAYGIELGHVKSILQLLMVIQPMTLGGGYLVSVDPDIRQGVFDVGEGHSQYCELVFGESTTWMSAREMQASLESEGDEEFDLGDLIGGENEDEDNGEDL